MRIPFVVACCLLAARPALAAPPVDFNTEVLPILAGTCYQCHGPDEKARKAKLRLDVRDVVLDRGVLVPGKPDDSELLRRVSSDDTKERMPPPASKKAPLTADQVAILKRWVAEGAKYSEHWSFAKLARPEVPGIDRTPFPVRNPIDNFILYRLRQAGVSPSREADRVTLIRRLSFDLTGLPPTTEEVRAFVEDKSPDAYEKLVDRMMSSPHFG